MNKNVKIVVISIATPILVGIYEDNNLIKTISQDGKTSDILPLIFKNLLKQYNIIEIIYINGPGSFMAIKVAYIFLKTLSIIHKIPLKACDGFSFNNNTPIKALAKKYFFKDKDGKIHIDFLEDTNILRNYTLPSNLDSIKFDEDSLPKYNLPAVS